MTQSTESEVQHTEPQRELELTIQTPRGVWDRHNPPHAKKKPVYRPSASVQNVINDARSVFAFIEQDNNYVLLLRGKPLAPHSTLREAGVDSGDVLVLTVQGGNA